MFDADYYVVDYCFWRKAHHAKECGVIHFHRYPFSDAFQIASVLLFLLM